MPIEQFLQNMRKVDRPHGNRSTSTGAFKNQNRQDELKAAAEIPTGLEHRRITLPDGPQTHARVKTLPIYWGDALTRSVRIWRGKRTGSKCAPHPMRGFRSPKAAHRNGE